MCRGEDVHQPEYDFRLFSKGIIYYKMPSWLEYLIIEVAKHSEEDDYAMAVYLMNADAEGSA